MKFKTTIWIGIIGIALTSYVYFYEIRGEEARRLAKEKRNRICQFEINSIEKFRIDKADSSFELQKQNNTWMVVSPVQYKGDNNNIEEMLDVLLKAKKEDIVEKDSDKLGKYGLGQNAPLITVSLKDSAEFSVRLGDVNPFNTNVYALLVDNNEVILTSIDLKQRANEPLIYYRDKSILDFNKSDIVKIIFHEKGKEIILQRGKEFSWSIVKPIQYLAENTKIDLILEVLKNQPIRKFVDENPTDLKQYGLKNSDYWIELFSIKNDIKKILYIGNFISPYFLIKDKDKNIVFAVDSSLAEQLKPDIFSLQNKRISECNVDAVDFVKLKYPNISFEFEKDTVGSWYMKLPEKHKTNPDLFTQILKGLYWTRAEKIIDNVGSDIKKYNIIPPDAEFILYSKGKEVLRAQLGKKIDVKNRYFYNITDNKIFLVRAGLDSLVALPIDKLIETKK